MLGVQLHIFINFGIEISILYIYGQGLRLTILAEQNLRLHAKIKTQGFHMI